MADYYEEIYLHAYDLVSHAREGLQRYFKFYNEAGRIHRLPPPDSVYFESLPILMADPLLFRRALTNLLANGIRHTPVGGQITLKVSPATDGESMDISVSDTGCGIAPQHLPKVFDRFYRVDQARSADAHSTGLGLAIVKSIMAMHDGTVTLDSLPDQGTTVTLHFPSSL